MNHVRLHTEYLSKMEEKDLNEEYLRCRSKINKTKYGTYERRKFETDMCYILREIEIRKTRSINYLNYQRKRTRYYSGREK